MEVTVPLTVTVEPWMDIDGWEQAVMQAGRQAMAAALQALQSAHEAIGPCPTCTAEDDCWDGTRSRVMLTSFGRVVVRMRRVRCRACGHRHRPAATLLAALGRGNTTAALRTAAVAAGSSWPFATAARLLGDLLGAAISPEQVRQLTITTGRQVAHDQQATAATLVAPSADAVRATRVAESERTRYGSRPVAAAAVPPRLLVGLADALGATQSPTQVVLGDGAEWIKHQTRQHFPEATGILDWAHLARIMLRAVRLACPSRGQRDQQRAMYRCLTEQLWHGAIDAATDTLVALRDPASGCPALEEAIGYLASQRDWLGDYAAWRAHGYPIGNGMIERAVALVINWRMKDRGMRWTRASASAIVAIRVDQLNQDWDDAMSGLELAA